MRPLIDLRRLPVVIHAAAPQLFLRSCRPHSLRLFNCSVWTAAARHHGLKRPLPVRDFGPIYAETRGVDLGCNLLVEQEPERAEDHDVGISPDPRWLYEGLSLALAVYA